MKNKKTIIAGLDGEHDMLTSTGQAWNSRFGEVFNKIDLRDPKSSVLARYEYNQTNFPGSKWSILKCSDNQMECGVPFKDSYSVLNMEKLTRFIESLLAGLDKLGVKWTIKTTGTLRNRNRQFVSIEIAGYEKFQVDGREINSFLNVLNSVDKSCHVTFSNNTFTVCCKNTFANALTGKGAGLHGMVKHTKGMGTLLADVPRIVESYISGNEKLLETLKSWSLFPVGLGDAEQLFAAWLGTEGQDLSARTANTVDRLSYLFAKGQGNKGETAFDLFNAVTEYYTHESAGKSDDKNKQFSSSEDGDGAKAKREFFEYLNGVLVNSASYKGFCKVGDSILVAYRNKPKK